MFWQHQTRPKTLKEVCLPSDGAGEILALGTDGTDGFSPQTLIPEPADMTGDNVDRDCLILARIVNQGRLIAARDTSDDVPLIE